MFDMPGPLLTDPEFAPTEDDDPRYAKLLALLDTGKILPGGEDFVMPGSSPNAIKLERVEILSCGELLGGKSSRTIIAYSIRLKKMVWIRNIGQYKYESLVQDFGEGILKTVFDGKADSIPMGMLTFSEVKQAIAAEASKRQIAPGDMKGVGVWGLPDDGVVLVGSDKLAILDVAGTLEITSKIDVDGKLFELSGLDPWFNDDELKQNLDDALDPQWCSDVLTELIAVITQWDNVSRVGDHELIAALAASSWLQTLWTFRPIVVVTGPSNSGKTMLLEDAVGALFGNLKLVMNKPSEAGFRQTVGDSAVIPVIDEFEKCPDRPKLYETLRTTTRGARIQKGTSGGKPIRYGIRHQPWLGSIESGLREAADKNRTIRIELTPVDLKKSGRNLLVAPDPEMMRELGQRVLAVMLRNWKAVRDRVAELAQLMTKEVDSKRHREVDCLALPTAVLGVVLQKTVPESLDILRGFLSERTELQEDLERDDERLLKAIYCARVEVKGREGNRVYLAGSLITQGFLADAEKRDHLDLCGLRVVHNPKRRKQTHPGDYLFVAQDLVTAGILKNTEWAGLRIIELLGRIPGAFNNQCKFGGVQVMGTFVPLDQIRAIAGSLPDGATDTAEETASSSESIGVFE